MTLQQKPEENMLQFSEFQIGSRFKAWHFQPTECKADQTYLDLHVDTLMVPVVCIMGGGVSNFIHLKFPNKKVKTVSFYSRKQT